MCDCALVPSLAHTAQLLLRFRSACYALDMLTSPALSFHPRSRADDAQAGAAARPGRAAPLLPPRPAPPDAVQLQRGGEAGVGHPGPNPLHHAREAVMPGAGRCASCLHHSLMRVVALVEIRACESSASRPGTFQLHAQPAAPAGCARRLRPSSALCCAPLYASATCPRGAAAPATRSTAPQAAPS